MFMNSVIVSWSLKALRLAVASVFPIQLQAQQKAFHSVLWESAVQPSIFLPTVLTSLSLFLDFPLVLPPSLILLLVTEVKSFLVKKQQPCDGLQDERMLSVGVPVPPLPARRMRLLLLLNTKEKYPFLMYAKHVTEVRKNWTQFISDTDTNWIWVKIALLQCGPNQNQTNVCCNWNLNANGFKKKRENNFFGHLIFIGWFLPVPELFLCCNHLMSSAFFATYNRSS